MKILLTYFLLTLGGIAASIILYILLFGIVFFIFNIVTNIKYKTFNTSDNKFNITQWVDKSFEKSTRLKTVLSKSKSGSYKITVPFELRLAT